MTRSRRHPETPAQPPGAAIEILRAQSLATLVRRELEHRILSGALAPGDKLNEADLAAELNISRGPVREAFRALAEGGLVHTEKNRGVFVRQVSVEEANEIYDVRAALERQIGRLAASRIRPDELARLRAIVRRMHEVARARDADAYFPLNLEFHDVLAQAARNRSLADYYRRVVNELNLYRRETLTRIAEDIPVSTRDHEAIVTAVAAGDAARAEHLLYEHVIDSRERLRRLMESTPARAGRRGAKAA
ncbi:MAG: FCD domain-containing protein [Burkholderiales bacterium]|nr:FCD domain-containing protein [Burkholderiales bacterium]